ncbi:MAG: DNA internalization-related competence protein ComEC/Rec2 [Nitrospiria bacterium]
MRRVEPLTVLTLSCLSGLVLGEIFSYFPITISLVLLALLLMEAHYRQGRIISFPVYLVGVVGFIWIQISSIPTSEKDLRWHVDRGPIRIVAEVSEPLRQDPRRTALQMKGLSILSKGLTRPVGGRFQLNIWQEAVPFEYGDRLEMVIRLRRPRQFQNDGSFQYADYRERLGSAGIANVSHIKSLKKVGEGGYGVLKRFFRWREKLRRRIIASMGDPAAPLLLAFVLGDTAYLSDEVREAFASAGVAHLLAVSGTHLSLVSLLVFASIRALLLHLPPPMLLRLSLWKMPSQWAVLPSAAVAIFYACLAGAKIGTLRALTMILVYLVSVWIGRSRDAVVSLSLAALLIVVFQARAIFEISFQLSFIAVLSIILMMEEGKERPPADTGETPPSFFQRVMKRRARPLFLSTIAASLGTAPLTLYYFHQFSWVGLLSNLILLPLAGCIMVPLALMTMIGTLIVETGLPFVVFQEWLWSFFYRLVIFFAAFPGAGVHFASPPLALMVLYYLGFFSLIGGKGRRKRYLIIVASILLVFLGWGGLRMPPNGLRVTFIDVGQGDAALIEFKNGKTMLIDGGTRIAGKFGVAPHLWERRIRKIDFLVGTHPQRDHIGGFSDLIRRFEVGEVWTNGQINDSPAFQALGASIRKHGVLHRMMSKADGVMNIEGCLLRFLNPGVKASFRGESANNRSLVLHLGCPSFARGAFSILFTGDIEKAMETMLVETSSSLHSEVLKVPHHGSRSSSSRPFISAVSPGIVVLSAGAGNPYRHPHPEILSHYQAAGAEIFRTDRHGAVTISLEREEDGFAGFPSVRTYREEKVGRIEWSAAVIPQEWENMEKAFFPLLERVKSF